MQVLLKTEKDNKSLPVFFFFAIKATVTEMISYIVLGQVFYLQKWKAPCGVTITKTLMSKLTTENLKGILNANFRPFSFEMKKKNYFQSSVTSNSEDIW